MKKVSGILLITIVTFYITGCKKLYDQVHKDPGQEYKYCDIKKFKVWFGDTYNEFNVTYNNKGQPKDVIGIYPDSPLHNFSFEQHFRYDKKGRLTDWITNPPGNLKVWLWDTYHYISETQVLDTTYYGYDYGSLATDPHAPYTSPTFRERLIEYDSYGRTIKITNNPGGWVQTIEYDANGNSTGYSSYDSAVNIVRTNKIWMFVNNNYNVNNYIETGWGTNLMTYNAYKLPTSFILSSPSPDASEQFMTAFVFDKMVVEYDCKGNPKFY